MTEVEKYLNNECDDSQPLGGSNLTKSELKGLKEIKHGVRNLGWCLYQTDKSGRMVLDTMENFISCMHDHIVNDSDATLEDVRVSELHLNNTSRLWVNRS